jgi:hypothetical protein
VATRGKSSDERPSRPGDSGTTGGRPPAARPSGDEGQRGSGAIDGSVTVVRVRCYLYARPSGPRGRLLIEQKAAAVPRDQRGNLDAILGIYGEARQKQDVRDRLVDAIAEYVTNRVDSYAFEPVRRQWEIPSDALDRSQQWLQSLVEKPFQSVLGPGPAAVGSIATDLATGQVMRRVQVASQILDVAGIVFGAAMGMPPLVVASAKHLAYIEFHRAVAREVITAFGGLLVGSRDVSRAPGSRPMAREFPPPPTPGLGPRPEYAPPRTIQPRTPGREPRPGRFGGLQVGCHPRRACDCWLTAGGGPPCLAGPSAPGRSSAASRVTDGCPSPEATAQGAALPLGASAEPVVVHLDLANRATESNPHDQLGRLVAGSGRRAQLAAMTGTYNTSTPPVPLLGRNLGRKSVLAAVCAAWCSVLSFCIHGTNVCSLRASGVSLWCSERESRPQGRSARGPGNQVLYAGRDR